MNKLKEKIQVLLADIKYICDEYVQDILDDCVLLQELIDQQKQPTLEEMKKEWEDDGYEWLETNEAIHIINPSKKNTIQIWKKLKTYSPYSNINYNEWQPITFKEHTRLTKTLRALDGEVTNNE